MKHFEDFEREASQYPKILERYEKKGIIFEDQNFLPKGRVKEPKVEFNEKEHIWERIDKYYTAPLFKKEAISEDAIQQGELGTCYFVASLCRIARQPELVEKLFDTRTRSKKKNGKKKNDQFFDSINLKCGAVIVYFHAFGRLTPVLIDTLVPFKRGTRRPRFVHPADINFSPWFCLVEKAFAKLHGSYSLIIGGALSSAIYHLFGYFPCYKGITEMLEKREEKLKKKQELEKSTKPIKFDKNEYLFSQLMRWQHENAVLGADITLDNLQEGVSENDVIDNGLVTGHAYLIMKVRTEQNKNFICLRNPWGDHEWLGDWSDTSPLWTPELKKKLGVHSKNDGTFWMLDKDFFKYFSSFDVAKPVNPEYHIKSFMTRLSPGSHDGHSLNSKSSDLEHHQTFVFKLKNARIKSKDGDDDGESKNDDKKSKDKNVQTLDDIKVYIRIEKRSPLYDTASDTILDKTEYAMFIVYNDGKKIEFDRLCYCNRSWVSTSSRFFRSTHHIKENKPFVIVFQRLTKSDFTEEIYVQISCKYDFDLYDCDYPDSKFKEDEKFDVVFNNESKRVKGIARKLRVKSIGGKEVNSFETNTVQLDDNFYKHLNFNKDSENGNRYFEYDITDTSESETDKKKRKNKKDTKKDSSKEMKKILEKKREVEEKEREIEEEKMRIAEEKNKLLQQQKEIQKENKKIEEESKKLEQENKKLEEEKKKFEEEKKRSSKKIVSKEEDSDNDYDNENNENSNNKIIEERKVELNNSNSDSESGDNGRKQANSKRKQASKVARSESESYESDTKNQKKKRSSNKSKRAPTRRNRQDSSDSGDSEPKGTKKKRRSTQDSTKKASQESLDSKQNSRKRRQAPAGRNAQESSDSSDSEPISARKDQNKGKAARSTSQRNVQESSDSEPRSSRRSHNKGKAAGSPARRNAQESNDSSDSEPRRARRGHNKGKEAGSPSQRNAQESYDPEPKSRRSGRLNNRNARGQAGRKEQYSSDSTESSDSEPRSAKRVHSRGKTAPRKASDSESSYSEEDKKPQRHRKRAVRRSRNDDSDSSSESASKRRKAAASTKSNTRNNLRKPSSSGKSKTQRVRRNQADSYSYSSDSNATQNRRNKAKRPAYKGQSEDSSNESSTNSNIRTRNKRQNQARRANQTRNTRRENSYSESSD